MDFKEERLAIEAALDSLESKIETLPNAEEKHRAIEAAKTDKILGAALTARLTEKTKLNKSKAKATDSREQALDRMKFRQAEITPRRSDYSRSLLTTHAGKVMGDKNDDPNSNNKNKSGHKL